MKTTVSATTPINLHYAPQGALVLVHHPRLQHCVFIVNTTPRNGVMCLTVLSCSAPDADPNFMACGTVIPVFDSTACTLLEQVEPLALRELVTPDRLRQAVEIAASEFGGRKFYIPSGLFTKPTYGTDTPRAAATPAPPSKF